MLWIILVTLVAVLIWLKYIRPLNHWTNLGVKQVNPWIFLGDYWPVVLRKISIVDLVYNIYNKYPNLRLTGIYQFSTPTLVIKDPELIKDIAVKDFDHFTDHKFFINPDVDPLWRGNVFALRGQKWRQMRATLSGAFTSSKMKNMFFLMDEAAEHFVKHFLNKNQDKFEIELKETFRRYTNDVIASTAFGIKVDSLSEPKNDFYEMGQKVTNFTGFIMNMKIVLSMLVPKLLKMLKIQIWAKEIENFFETIVEETIKVRKEKGIVRPDMIHLLMEAQNSIQREKKEAIETDFATEKELPVSANFKQLKNLTNHDIVCQAFVFFFGGFDTISTSLCFGAHELAFSPDIQDRLREEIVRTHKENNGKLTYDILLNMKYLDMVVSEILRKWPPGIFLDRCCTKPYTIPPATSNETPINIRVGDLIWFPVYGIHRDPNYYENPEKFDPERFSEENKASIKPYTYIPFGTGPRNCLGSRFALLEIKALLFHLLLNFKILPSKMTNNPIRFSKKTMFLVVDEGFWFDLARINN